MNKGNIEAVYPLSPMQQGMYFHSELNPDSGVYIEQMNCEIEGDLSVDHFIAACQAIVDRHTILRTAFAGANQGRLLQVVGKKVKLPFETLDWSGFSEEVRQDELTKLQSSERNRGFELGKAPLMRVKLIRLAPRRFHFIWTHHHLLLDGWSVPIVLREVFLHYEAFRRGATPALGAARPFRDYVGWLSRQDAARAERFWRDRLRGGSGATEIPKAVAAGAGGEARAARSAELRLRLDARRSELIGRFAQRARVTVNTLVQGAWALVLSGVSGERDVQYGATVSGRPAELAGAGEMVGLFINTLPVRVRVAGEQRIDEWLAALQREQTESREYEYSPLTEIRKWAGTAAEKKLFESILVFENYPLDTALKQQPDSLKISNLNLTEQSDQPLTIVCDLRENLVVRFKYNESVFSNKEISRLAEYFSHVIQSICGGSSEKKVKEISLISDEEKAQILDSWSAGADFEPYQGSLLAQIAQRAAERPAAIAVRAGEHALSYRELDTRSNQLARLLRARGVRSESRVGVMLERSVELIVSLLGVMKAGGGYVPLDPGYPRRRLEYMATDAELTAVISRDGQWESIVGASSDETATAEESAEESSTLAQAITATAEVAVIDWERDRAAIEQLSEEALDETERPLLGGQQMAYMIYTSGSTGQPKGAVNTLDGMFNRLEWMRRHYRVDESDRILQKTPVSFDVSVWELFLPLMAGAELVMAAPGGHRDSRYLVREIKERRITMLHFVPSMLQVFVEEPEVGECVSVRQIISSGEALTGELAARVRRRLPTARLDNLYGPTEAAVDVTFWRCGQDDEQANESNQTNGSNEWNQAIEASESSAAIESNGSNGSNHASESNNPNQANEADQTNESMIVIERANVPIGTAVANVRMYVLDERFEVVPHGVRGELFIGGIQVGRGYWAKAALTAEKFVPDPFAGAAGARMYRTGDYGRGDERGVLQYLGRVDEQVKIRGNRIEIGEIEAVLEGCAGVRQAAVRVWGERGREQLVAYLVMSEGSRLEAERLRAQAGERLPEPMLPTMLIELDEMPLSVNGKVARGRLPKPEGGDLRAGEYRAAETETERQLAAVWEQALGVEPIGIDDNFFLLGGDSIRSLQIRALLRKSGIDVSLHDIFQFPTIRSLAGQMKDQRTILEKTEVTVPFSLISEDDRKLLPENVVDSYPLTYMQSGMLFHSVFDSKSTAYHNVTSYHLNVRFEFEQLKSAVNEVIDRHPVLRTAFDLSNFSQPLQLVYQNVPAKIDFSDLRGFADEEQERIIKEWIQTEKRTPFDLSEPGLIRFNVHLRSDATFQFSFSEHHAIVDGWSVATMMTELFTLYFDRIGIKPAQLKPLPELTYRDFVAAERRALESDETKSFWLKKVENRIATEIPRWSEKHRETNYSGNRVKGISLSKEHTRKIKGLASRLGVPVKSVLLASHLFVLSVVCGQKDILTGLVSNGRLEENDSERVLGLFLNTLPFRIKLQSGSWAELIAEVFRLEKEILPHRWYPMAQLQKNFKTPLFETDFDFTHFHVYQSLEEFKGILLDHQGYEETNFTLTANFSLDLNSEQIWLSLYYLPKSISAEQIEYISRYYRQTLESIAENPQARYEAFSPLSPEERQQLLDGWSAGATLERYEGSLLDQIAQRAAERPDAIAVRAGDRALSYRELETRSNQLARLLRARGVRAEARVGVMLERSVELIVSLLGVLKAGGGYVPLDPGYPRRRLAYMARDAALAAVISRNEQWQAVLGDDDEANETAGSTATVVGSPGTELEFAL